MDIISIFTTGMAAASAMKLINRARNGSGESFNTTSDHVKKQDIPKLPDQVITILKTKDQSMGYTGKHSRMRYAEHLYYYYDLEKMGYIQSTPKYKVFSAECREDVLNSHSFFLPYKRAFEAEIKIRDPLNQLNLKSLHEKITEIAADWKPGDYIVNPGDRYMNIRYIAEWMMEKIQYQFKDFEKDQNGQITGFKYTVQWEKNIRVPSYVPGSTAYADPWNNNGGGHMINGFTPIDVPDYVPDMYDIFTATGKHPINIQDMMYAVQAIGEAGEKDNIVCYMLIAQELIDKFFFIFLDHDDEHWIDKYYNKPIDFPKFDTVDEPEWELPDIMDLFDLSVTGQSPTGLSEGQISGLYMLYQNMRRYMKPYAKDMYTAFSPNANFIVPFGINPPEYNESTGVVSVLQDLYSIMSGVPFKNGWNYLRTDPRFAPYKHFEDFLPFFPISHEKIIEFANIQWDLEKSDRWDFEGSTFANFPLLNTVFALFNDFTNEPVPNPWANYTKKWWQQWTDDNKVFNSAIIPLKNFERYYEYAKMELPTDKTELNKYYANVKYFNWYFDYEEQVQFNDEVYEHMQDSTIVNQKMFTVLNMQGTFSATEIRELLEDGHAINLDTVFTLEGEKLVNGLIVKWAHILALASVGITNFN